MVHDVHISDGASASLRRDQLQIGDDPDFASCGRTRFRELVTSRDLAKLPTLLSSPPQMLL